MNTTVRKLMKPAENQKVSLEYQQVTPEDINVKSLYAMFGRIYPIPYIPQAGNGARAIKSTVSAK